jgi:hypothetical protein
MIVWLGYSDKVECRFIKTSNLSVGPLIFSLIAVEAYTSSPSSSHSEVRTLATTHFPARTHCGVSPGSEGADPVV